ncbi:hypothetical protein ADICEAN_00475 [Cesiribacter andamanensis AMV16]|uniref:Uncharacterized protein n=1 Tax=Cesiribacter andamanensis AMV16 TaxID=1279009 RepID=M7NAN7_9BACT|nr:hypothetical protein ADICEAN_00475 [Cesiribacter andamanensis AMV16]
MLDVAKGGGKLLLPAAEVRKHLLALLVYGIQVGVLCQLPELVYHNGIVRIVAQAQKLFGE